MLRLERIMLRSRSQQAKHLFSTNTGSTASSGMRSVDPALLSLDLDDRSSCARVNRSEAYTRLLRWCGEARAVDEGEKVYSHMKNKGFTGLGNLVIGMYGKCGCLADAREVFERIATKDSSSWNSIIVAYAQNGEFSEAVSLFERMISEGVSADKCLFSTIISARIHLRDPDEALLLFWRLLLEGVRADAYTVGLVIKACTQLGDLRSGRVVHETISGTDVELHVVVANGLITMYGKCGRPREAKEFFDSMPARDVISWNALISAFAQLRYWDEALVIYQRMQHEGVNPDAFTFIGILESCSSIEEGRRIHSFAESLGHSSELGVGNSLLGMYGRCSSVRDAREVFDAIGAKKNSVSWAAMLSTYTQLGHATEALELSKLMNLEGVKFNRAIFLSLIAACAQLEDLNRGRFIHEEFVAAGFQMDVMVETSLVNMYGKCGDVEEARRILDQMPVKSPVSWTAMITAYARHHRGSEALELLRRMDLEGAKASKVTFVSILDACASLGDSLEGKILHDRAVSSGFGSDMNVNNTLVSMYGKCGSLGEARRVFDAMPRRDIISWNALLVEYSQQGFGKLVVDLFRRMDLEGLRQDRISFTALLNACVSLEHSKLPEFHRRAEASGFGGTLSNFLIISYARSEGLEVAKAIFDQMKNKDLVSWNAMLTAFIHHKCNSSALELFHDMDLEGFKQDRVSFLLALDACSGSATSTQGFKLHQRIASLGIDSGDLMQNAILNMYAECGNVKAAREQFDRMRWRDVVSWTAMLAAYAQHGNCSESLKLFRRMQQDGRRPDEVSFLCVVFSCSHSGVVKDALLCFSSMIHDYGIEAGAEHCGCIVDVLGKAGRLDEAEEFGRKMGVKDVVSWRSLLGACRIHGDKARGTRAAARIKDEVGVCVLLSNLYAE